jgi:hypothetical protein
MCRIQAAVLSLSVRIPEICYLTMQYQLETPRNATCPFKLANSRLNSSKIWQENAALSSGIDRALENTQVYYRATGNQITLSSGDRQSHFNTLLLNYLEKIKVGFCYIYSACTKPQLTTRVLKRSCKRDLFLFWHQHNVRATTRKVSLANHAGRLTARRKSFGLSSGRMASSLHQLQVLSRLDLQRSLHAYSPTNHRRRRKWSLRLQSFTVNTTKCPHSRELPLETWNPKL